MNSIELMIAEHSNISRMLTVVRKACSGILNGDPINYDDFDQMIDFIKNYADIHHHGKEEKFLFKEMVDNLGPLGNKLVTHGMLVEHDFGRLFISELTNALQKVKAGDDISKIDVIANAVGYANHLQRHIDKENTVVFPFAQKKLSKEIMDKVEQDSINFENEAKEKGIQEHYIQLLEALEVKYNA